MYSIKEPARIIILDLPRTVTEAIPWRAIEEIKNGRI